VDKDNLEPGRGQQHGVTTGSHYDDISMFDFNDNYPFSPPLEPGPLRVPRTHQVFKVEPDRELDEEGEGEEEPEQGEDTYVWFQPDVGSEGEGDDEDDEVWIEDPRLARGEDAHQLDVKWELDDIGSAVFSRAEKDNIEAMALKIRNQLTRKTYKGVQKLTEGHMVIGSKYVAGQVLECASGLAFQVYDCCSNSCVCFAGEFESLTVCPLCSEPRYNSQWKARNRFWYIPIIPCLQVMFRD